MIAAILIILLCVFILPEDVLEAIGCAIVALLMLGALAIFAVVLATQ